MWRHTREEPCDYRDNNMEHYDPVKTADDRYTALHKGYKALVAADQKSGSLAAVARINIPAWIRLLTNHC